MPDIAVFLANPLYARITALIASGVLLLLSFLHFYWAVGGKWGLRAAVPEWEGKPLFLPTAFSAFFIGLALLIAAVVLPGRVGFYGTPQLEFIYLWTPWLMTVIFLLRTIGDLRFIGLFKRVRFTYFAWWDTRLHTPLCLVLFLLNLHVALSPVPWSVV